MNLKEFVKESLSQIIAGVREARSSDEDGWTICPGIMVNYDEATKMKAFLDHHRQPVYLVEFDVALSAAEGLDAKGGIGVVSGIFNLWTQGVSSTLNSTLSRIKFTVPIRMPNEDYKPAKKV